MTRAGAWVALALFTLTPACSAGDEPAPARAASVLLITLDTTRADRLGAYGYASARTPNLDALARRGVRFDDATTVAPITGPAHAAILTGVQPARHAVRDNATTPLPADATTLAELLAPRGFATGGFVGAFILDRPYGFAQGFDTFASGFTQVASGTEASAERPADAVVDDAVAWLTSLPADRPFFGWVHLYDPHVRYTPPSGFEQTYDGEIAFVDQQVGRLLATLRGRNLFDSTLIVVIGDHGESLGEHGEDEHGVFLYDAVMRVPFIVAGPGAQAGHVVREQVQALDVTPSVLEALGIPRPASLDGESLAPLLAGGSRTAIPAAYAESYYPKLHYGWSELRSVRADGWKAIDAPKPELYNLRDDPREQTNLYASQRALGDRMIAEAARLGRELAGGVVTPARQPDRATLERLRSLGYVGSSAPLPSGERGPDPKDRIGERREFNALMAEALDDLRGGRPAAAVPKFTRLILINSRSYDLHLFLGEAYDRVGNAEAALGEYEFAALLNPDVVTPVIAAGEVLLRRGDVAGARRRLEEARQIEAESFEVLMLTGRIFERDGRHVEALAAYERAVAANPANPRARTQVVSLTTRTGRWSEAEVQLRALLAMGYQPSRTLYALGRAAQAQGRPTDAVARYREALRLEPGLTMAVEGLRSLGER